MCCSIYSLQVIQQNMIPQNDKSFLLFIVGLSLAVQLKWEDVRKRGAENWEEEASKKKVVWEFHSHKGTQRKTPNYSGENLLNLIKLNSILIIVDAGCLGPAQRGSCDLCWRLTMKFSYNSCSMAGKLMYLDAQALSVTFPLINEHLLSVFGYTALPAWFVWITDF